MARNAFSYFVGPLGFLSNVASLSKRDFNSGSGNKRGYKASCNCGYLQSCDRYFFCRSRATFQIKTSFADAEGSTFAFGAYLGYEI